jgi:hypothetical protein
MWVAQRKGVQKDNGPAIADIFILDVAVFRDVAIHTEYS